MPNSWFSAYWTLLCFSGRIHSALVSGVDWESRIVTVEWFERGETKGKGVEIDAILALNPELCLHPLPAAPQSMPNKLTRVRLSLFLRFICLHENLYNVCFWYI